MLVPALPQAAQAASNGYSFVVDNIVYSVNVERYVLVMDVEDPAALPPVRPVPCKV